MLKQKINSGIWYQKSELAAKIVMFLFYISSENLYFLLCYIKMTHSKVTKTCRGCEENLYAYIVMQFFLGIRKSRVLFNTHLPAKPNSVPPAKAKGEMIWFIYGYRGDQDFLNIFFTSWNMISRPYKNYFVLVYFPFE